MVGALYIRTLDKAERINKAMYLRGFNGEFPPELNLMRNESYILFGVAFLVIITTINSYLHT
jgi:cobalt/nickel transport system permease protein